MRRPGRCSLLFRIPVLPRRPSLPAGEDHGDLSRSRAPRLLALLLALVLQAGTLAFLLLGNPDGAWASLSDDRYDGNIFALYAGNGSLVPPRSTLAQARADGRVAVVVYYLDDCSVCKRFAPVVSELQRRWGNAIELIPLVTDPLQNRPLQGPLDPASYWKGTIPQVVVIDGSGSVVFDADGAVTIDAIDAAISGATGIPLTPGTAAGTTLSFNELNSEVVSSRP
jgi:thiol-disulfide isomerase/thioredoxin